MLVADAWYIGLAAGLWAVDTSVCETGSSGSVGEPNLVQRA